MAHARVLLGLVLLSGCAAPPSPAGEDPPAPGASPAFVAQWTLDLPGGRPSEEGGGAALSGLEWGRRHDTWLSGAGGIRVVRNGTEDVRVACACPSVAVLPADADRDGDRDALVHLADGSLRMLRNDGASLAEADEGLPLDVATAAWLDVDNDGLLDVLAARGGGVEALRNANGSFEPFPEAVWPGLPAASAILVADLDADGLVDVFASTADGLAVARNLNGSFERGPTFPVGARADVLITGDVDRTGTQDVLAAGEGGIELLRNLRGRDLRPAAAPVVEGAVRTAVLLDADLDGSLDLVVAPAKGGLVLARGGGDGTFAPVPASRSGLPASGDVLGLAVGDADGDGRQDVLAAGADGTATLHRNAGADGRFFRVVPSGVLSNRDGLGARVVAVENASLSERYVLLGSGRSTSAPEVVVGLGSGALVTLRIQWPSGTLQDRRIPSAEGFDRLLFASEEQALSQWGDASC